MGRSGNGVSCIIPDAVNGLDGSLKNILFVGMSLDLRNLSVINVALLEDSMAYVPQVPILKQHPWFGRFVCFIPEHLVGPVMDRLIIQGNVDRPMVKQRVD